MLKNLAKMACVAAGVMLAACSGDPSGSVFPAAGSFQGTFRGTAWSGRAYAVLRGDSLTVVGHRPDPQYLYDEYLQVQVLFKGAGTYAIPENAGKIAEIVGGDAGIFPPAGGTLVISSYDARTRTITGSIDLTAASMSPAWTASGSFEAPVYPSFNAVPPAR